MDRTLTLTVPIPAESEGLPRVLEIVPLFDGVGASCPVTVTANGKEVGTFDLMNERKRAIPLRASLVTRDANGNSFFVKHTDGGDALCFGVQTGLQIIMR